jgi:glycosyltransferase involved in cell wall biosynthesis
MTYPNQEIDIIGNAVDTDLFPRKPVGIHGLPIRLLCVCRLVKRKGIEFLIEAMHDVAQDGITLEIVGTGDMEKEVRKLIDTAGLSDKIKLSGYVPRECLSERYHAADIFVLPSLCESFGQVLLEAMSCGLPIIASRTGGIPETIDHHVNGLLVEPASAIALSAAIRTLAADARLRSEMGANNARRARSHYSWDTVADRYEEHYYKAVNQQDKESVLTLRSDR